MLQLSQTKSKGKIMELRNTENTGFAALLIAFETRRNIRESANISKQGVLWWERNGIPPARRPALIEAAKKRGWHLDNEQLRGDL